MMNFKSRHFAAALAIGSLAVVGGAWALLGKSTEDVSPTGLPAELSVASLKKKAADPLQLGETMRETFRREDLTEEQRRELRSNMREVWTSAMNQRVDEYYNAPESQREALLDRHIDQMAARMKQFEERRREREAERKRNGEPAMERGRPPFPTQTRQERKMRSESRSPDQTARAMLYFNNLRARAEARGMQLPFRGPGRGPGRRP